MESLNLERRREYPLRNMGYSIYRFKWEDVWIPHLFLQVKEAIKARRRKV